MTRDWISGRACRACIFATVWLGSGSTAEAQPSLPRLVPTRTLRIDANVADLSEAGDMVVTPSGQIAVPQRGDNTIRFFDARGVQTTFGRTGSGPGEFRRAVNVKLLGDTVWVPDPVLRRATMISPQHTLMRTFPAPATIAIPGRAQTPRPIFENIFQEGVLADGTLLLSVSVAAHAPRPLWMPPAFEGQDYSVHIHATRAGDLLNVVGWAPTDSACDRRVMLDGSLNWARVPFCAPSLGFVAADGTRLAFVTEARATATAGTYRVTVIRATGDTIVSRSYRYVPIPVSKRAVDSTVARLLSYASGSSPKYLRDLTAAYASIKPASAYPPVREVLIGRDGSIWLELQTASTDHVWQMLDPAGQPVGMLTLPKSVTLMVADRTGAWGWDIDADDLPNIVGYRLTLSH